jgi:hypothetical protein
MERRSFRFVPPITTPSATDRLLGRPPQTQQQPIETQVGQANVKKGSDPRVSAEFTTNLNELKKLRALLLAKSVEEVQDEAIYALLQTFGSDEQDVEASSTKPLYKEILANYASMSEDLQALVEAIRKVQRAIEADLEKPSVRRNLWSEPDSAESVPSSVRKQTRKKPPAKVPSQPPPSSVPASSPPEKGGDIPAAAVPASPPPAAQKKERKTWAETFFGSKPAAATPAVVAAPVVKKEPEPVRLLAAAINNVLERALVPLLDALGAAAFVLGEPDVRQFMVYDERNKGRRRDLPTARLRIIDEEDPELVSVDYLLQRYEPILGNAFLRMYLDQIQRSMNKKGEALAAKLQTQQINAGEGGCFEFDRDLRAYSFLRPTDPDSRGLRRLRELPNQDDPEVREQIAQLVVAQQAAEALRLTDVETRFAPAWAFSVLGNSVFRAVASPGMLAAFEMAHNQVCSFPGCSTFTLKELLCSRDTMNNFVFLAARHYMSSISALTAISRSSNNKKRHNGGNYINVNHAREEHQKRAFVIKIWFESVYAVPNPLLDEFDKYRRDLLGPLDPEFEQRMTLYRAALPQRELRHRPC